MARCYNRLMGEKLLLVPWIMGILYSSIPLFWFAIHPAAQRWQQMRRSPYRVLLPLWMVIIIALGVLTWPWHAVRIYETPWAWLPAILLFALGAGTYFRIRREFGVTNFTGETELRPHEHQQALITTGLHARMRHPIYAAHLCAFTAWTLGSGLLINFVLLAAGAFITFPLMIWMEERELEKRFGQSYQEYRRAVPLIPGFNLYKTSANEKHAAS
jgi:protein-S-isoprenylcysteine O-methyltransferase Ste14